MLTASHNFCSPSPFPEQPNAMATASGEWGGLFFKGGGKRRGGFPPFPRRQTCGVAAELSRGHTTHIAFPSIHGLKPTHPPLPRLCLSAHHLHVNFSPACHLPRRSSISFCLSGWRNQWAVLAAGADTAAKDEPAAAPAPVSRHLCSSACSMLMKSSRVAAATEKIPTGSVKPIHGKM